LTSHRLYFSHSYDPEDRRFNEHLWKLLIASKFHTWIDTGRDVVTSKGQPGARLPMDISFNEWMISQCDGFVAIAPKKRQSEYQLLEYRMAVRMSVPRLVALQQGGTFNAPESEVVVLPTSWNLYWQEERQSAIINKIAAFAAIVEKQKAAGEVLQSIGHWRPRQSVGELIVALLQPRADDLKWVELQRLLQRNNEIQWILLSPANIRTERELLDKKFDLLVLDVGPRGSPQELLGYVHALGIPQIRLCRVDKEEEERELGRFLDPEETQDGRLLYEQDPLDTPRSIPRFLDGFKLDKKMQPVIFWTTPKAAADQILETMRRISMFRSGYSPEEGGTAETIDTHQNAKKYFDQHYYHAERGSVFISFAGQGGASKLADRLAQILRFLNLRCFHYRDKDSHSDGRLESGEDVKEGLKVRINEADVVIYLIEENFVESKYCRRELLQGVDLSRRGQIELRAYRLETMKNYPKEFSKEISSISVHDFREMDWSHTNVEQKIVVDVEKSVEAIGWALHEKDRATLQKWLKKDGRYSIEGVLRLLERMDVPKAELKAISEKATGASWLDAILRLPSDGNEEKRTRQIVALLLLAATYDDPDRRETAAYWLYDRRLLRWPPLVASDNEDFVEINAGLIATEFTDPTVEDMSKVGQKVGQKCPDILAGRRPVCVSAETDFLSIPIEWACETQDDQPIAARRPVRWHLPDVDTRTSVFDSIASNAIPPTTLILALAGPNINPGEQVRKLDGLLRGRYETLGWPPEFVTYGECEKGEDVLQRLRGCQQQVVHLAGHMGRDGLQVGNDVVDSGAMADALRESDVRLVVLNGCEGGKPKSLVAVDCLTLADSLIRDANVAEVVAHRGKISESDALAFAEVFYAVFFDSSDGFEPARAAFKARKAGSPNLRYWPVVISQRKHNSSREAAA